MAQSARIFPISPRAPGDIPVGTVVAPTGTPGVIPPFASVVAVQPTAPANPSFQNLWYNTTTMRLMLYTGTAWFQLL